MMTLPQIAEKPIGQVEKIARLMGLNYVINTDQVSVLVPFSIGYIPFNPLTNKSDLMDVECALEVNVLWSPSNKGRLDYLVANVSTHQINESTGFIYINDHNNDKFTARAHAVCAVAEQIYDKGTV
jgi:hypothetical protein